MIAAIALGAALQGQRPLSGSFPKPTGRNGYEEYVMAAEILRSPEANVYASWTPTAKPPIRDPDDPDDKGPDRATLDLYARLRALSPLDVRREELKRFGMALQLVAQGNAKPVSDPRKSLGPDALFPELASFRAVTRFAARAATVYAADGQTGRAVGVLNDQLLFADNIGRGVMISNLVGSASTAVTLAAFGELLPRLSRTDAGRVQRSVASILARPPAARSALPAELAVTKAAIREALSQKADPSVLLGDEAGKMTARERAMAKEFLAMTPASRRKMIDGLDARLDRRALAIDRIFTGPESRWASGIAALAEGDDEEPTNVADALIAILAPPFVEYAVVAARVRTQLRLLDIHAKLVQYRWDYGRLPDTLDLVDPLTGGPYVYERRSDGTVRLASRGIPQTGEIELRYRRVAPETPGAKP